MKNFDALVAQVLATEIRRRVAVVCAHDAHTLEAVVMAEKKGLIEAVLFGEEAGITEILATLGHEVPDERIVATLGDTEAAQKAVALVRGGKADFLMKGRIQTADLLRVVVDRERGLNMGRVISHVAFNELPGYPKLLAVTDGGMVMYPDLEKKQQIVLNAVDILHRMGIVKPKVAVLAAVEKVNPKMPETVDAAVLKEMSFRGEIPGCVLEGPISYDLTMSRESAAIKGFDSPVTGEADLLVVPNIAVGNILGKALVYSAHGKMAGIVVGAKVPIALSSRGATAEEKFLSIALCAAASR